MKKQASLALVTAITTIFLGLFPSLTLADGLQVSITSPQAGQSFAVGETINFSSAISGGLAPFGYAWIFGDGTSSVNQNTTHAYSAAGSYSITFQATDALGTQAQAQLSLTIATSDDNDGADDDNSDGDNNPAAPLVVTITSPQTTSFPVNETINFAASVSGGVAPFGYVWNFGDGMSSANQNPSKSYSTAGAYQVLLLVTDVLGTQSSGSLNLNITGGGGGGSAPTITISNIRVTDITATGATIRWTTNLAATSRVIYDTISHPTLGSAPNYGYANSSETLDTNPKVTEHAVVLTNLSPSTTYYFRVISET